AQEAASRGEVLVEFPQTSVSRAVEFFARYASSDIDDATGPAGHAFVTTWAIAERALLTNLIGVLSSPPAKGRELEIVQAMREGATLHEALATAKKSPEAPKPNPDSNVIPLRPRR